MGLWQAHQIFSQLKKNRWQARLKPYYRIFRSLSIKIRIFFNDSSWGRQILEIVMIFLQLLCVHCLYKSLLSIGLFRKLSFIRQLAIRRLRRLLARPPGGRRAALGKPPPPLAALANPPTPKSFVFVGCRIFRKKRWNEKKRKKNSWKFFFDFSKNFSVEIFLMMSRLRLQSYIKIGRQVSEKSVPYRQTTHNDLYY